LLDEVRAAFFFGCYMAQRLFAPVSRAQGNGLRTLLGKSGGENQRSECTGGAGFRGHGANLPVKKYRARFALEGVLLSFLKAQEKAPHWRGFNRY